MAPPGAIEAELIVDGVYTWTLSSVYALRNALISRQ